MPKTNDSLSPGNRDETKNRPAIIGPSMSIRGELTGNETVVIAGHLKGRIQLENHDLVIEKGGRVEADVTVRDLTLHGELIGNVSASERVLITEKARMTGDITSSRISILEGAQFKGSIKIERKSAG
ncbi:MAG TPA: polymer-forming cytoskeletal protein [Candidatus Aminicenantes bacterium]|nr:polymer-forming cytoskeletal protein [Acidobacteriota bacterium]HOI44510.1 polymer-forming cytoskeletal protein [Candidatus Aminicenantes bacterium]